MEQNTRNRKDYAQQRSKWKTLKWRNGHHFVLVNSFTPTSHLFLDKPHIIFLGRRTANYFQGTWTLLPHYNNISHRDTHWTRKIEQYFAWLCIISTYQHAASRQFVWRETKNLIMGHLNPRQQSSRSWWSFQVSHQWGRLTWRVYCRSHR